VSADTTYTRTLRRARDALGSVENLAADLGVSVADVEIWLSGAGDPPAAVFLRLIDIVAQGRSSHSQS
jgi:DNA-binding transcriptional regulator YiaG